MTPRSARRAAERKTRKANKKAALHQPNQNIVGAAMPVPLPSEPETLPVLPLPSVEPPEGPPAETPPPAISHEDRPTVLGESARDFEAIHEALEDHYMPGNPVERTAVFSLARALWFVKRRRQVFDTIESHVYAAKPDQNKWTEADFKHLALVDAYRTRADHALYNAQKEVDSFSYQRIEDYHFESLFDLGVRRLELDKKKYELALRTFELREKQQAEIAESAPAVKKAAAS